jgi:hypothetical protein
LGGSSPLLGIKAFLFLCDFLTIAVQTSVISLIYPKEKDLAKVKGMQLMMIFNPLAVISPAVHNLHIVNYLIISLFSYSVIKHRFNKGIITDVIAGIALYLDPSLIYMIVPVRLIASFLTDSTKGSLIGPAVIKSIMTWVLVVASFIFLLSGDWRSELRNYRNILFVRDHSENIGIFWYLFVELFKQHVPFY